MEYKKVRLIKEVEIDKYKPTRTTYFIRALEKGFSISPYWYYITSFQGEEAEEDAINYFQKFIDNKGTDVSKTILRTHTL